MGSIGELQALEEIQLCYFVNILYLFNGGFKFQFPIFRNAVLQLMYL